MKSFDGYVFVTAEYNHSISGSLKNALDQGAAVMVMSHLGRPTEGSWSEADSLAPVAAHLGRLIRREVRLVRDWVDGVDVQPGELVMLENCRMNVGEGKDDEALSKKYAALCDVFVMDAFGTAHRAEATTYGIAKYAGIACAGPLLAAELEDGGVRLAPIVLDDDPAAKDEPLYALYMSPRAIKALKMEVGDRTWNKYLQAAFVRASWGSKHPLFKGSPPMFENIIIKPLYRPVRFNAGSTTKIVAKADRLTGAETSVTINPALGATNNVDRCLLLGAQALAHVYGVDGDRDIPMKWMEKGYNFDRAKERAGDMMHGKAKLRFKQKNGDGDLEPTDHGVAVIDVVTTANVVK